MDQRPEGETSPPPANDDYFAVATPRPSTHESTQAPPPGAGTTVRPGPSLGTVLAMLVAAIFVVGFSVTWVLTRPGAELATPPEPTGAVADVPGATADPAPSVEGPDPLVVGYQVWARNDDGTPVRWNPCDPIHYVFNPAGAPAAAEVDISRAVSLITGATGLRFVYEGTTDEVPTRDRSPYQQDRYGDRWAPVLIAWASPSTADVPMISSDRGVSIPVAVGDGETDVFVSGQIVFNPDRQLASGFRDRRTSWGATILHELGHVVGLDHVSDPRQIMFTFPGEGAVQLGPGDIAGLREIGQGGCIDTPDPVDVDVRFVDDFGS